MKSHKIFFFGFRNKNQRISDKSLKKFGNRVIFEQPARFGKETVVIGTQCNECMY